MFFTWSKLHLMKDFGVCPSFIFEQMWLVIIICFYLLTFHPLMFKKIIVIYNSITIIVTSDFTGLKGNIL